MYLSWFLGEIMRLSARSRYAVRILLELAQCDSDRPTSAAVLAERTGITPLFVEQLLKPLRKVGLTKSRRGAAGGHFLAKSPEDITLYEVIDLMEGGVAILDCCSESAEACYDCPRMDECLIRGTWQKIIDVLAVELKKISLAKILADKPSNSIF